MDKKIPALLVIVAATLVAAWFLSRDGQDRTVSSQEASAVQDPFFGIGGDDIVRISLRRHLYEHGAFRPETCVLEKSGEGAWEMTVPVLYPVNLALVHEILGTLRGLIPRPLRDSEKEAQLLKTTRPPEGIEVSVRSASQGEIRFTVGQTRGETTFLSVPGSRTVFTAAGRIRKVFDRGPSDLRLRRITRFDNGAIERMTFHNPDEPFVLVRDDAAGIEGYRPQETVENFDAPKAVHRAAALSRLRAKAFYDFPHRFSPDDLRVTLEVRTDEGVTPVTLTFGGRDPQTGLHFTASSLSDQVFLLSPHMKSLFTASPEDFALTDEEVARRRALLAKLARHGHIHGAHAVLKGSEGNGSDHDDLGTDAHFEDHVE